jgi:hypothetical protein
VPGPEEGEPLSDVSSEDVVRPPAAALPTFQGACPVAAKATPDDRIRTAPALTMAAFTPVRAEGAGLMSSLLDAVARSR